ncbi:hypothetical protein FSS13T_13570 [Flavobacterium saliperosum S13]|uniref:HYR domain-containing protein n=1 Tax=Flavobacterium saliperosum S13 TaxID=1341155 RepID=A0ABN0QGS7_9FLAO|nr:HYR domain-containing protein [Flavobacterium saliperosum]ESU25892.1 hypothetical protein FSS13T_13570 [Flavobacterium saliperosum S13]
METSLLKKRFWNNLLLIIVLLAAGISYAHEIIPNRNSVHQSDAATVVTDKDDYQPGEYVIVSGSGWLPGETVQLHFDETPQVCTNDHDRFTVADANGNIYYNQFLINDRHLGVAFVLTATGQSSGYNAQTFFTDATWGLEVSTNGGSSYLINGAGPTVAFNSCETKQITFRITQQNNSNPNQSYTFALPAGFSISLPSSLAFFNAANNSISRSWNVSQYAANALCLSASSSSDALGSNQKIVFTCNVISVANVVSTEIMGRASNNATCLNPTGSSGVLMNTIRPKFSSSADTIPPVLTPGANQDVVLGSDCKIEIPDVKGSAVDNCSGVSIVQVPAAGEFVSSSHNGNVIVTVTATDAAGLTDIEEVTLTAKDETPPVLTPGANRDVTLGSDCKILIPDVKGSAVDNCSGVSIVQVPAAGELVSSSHNGEVVVTVTATDAAGLTDIEEVTLTAKDETPPVLTPGTDQDVVLGSDCKIEIPNVLGSATDNCSGVSIVQVPASGELVSSSHNGNIVVTVTATDAAGLTDIKEVTLTAKDETAPVLTPGVNQDVVLGSDCKILIPNVLGSAVDNCSGVTIVQVPAAGEFVSSSHNGEVVVTVTATDAAGLTDIEEVTLTAKDETAPVLTPGANQDVVLGSDCKIEIQNVLGSATDNCSGVSIVQVPAAGEFASSSHNGNIVVTVTATDAAGLTDIEEVTLTAKDETPPVLTPGTDQDVTLGSDCKIEIPNVLGSATDNCSGVSIVQVPASGELVSSSHNGNVVVTVTATDAAGLTDIEEVTLTAKDETPPVLTPGTDQGVVLGSDCKIEIPNVLGSAIDNCSGVTIVQVPAAGEFVSSSHNGEVVVTVTATDAAGLTDIEEVTLTAKDETPPTINCPSNISQPNDTGLCSAVVNYVAPVGNDNCSGQSTVQIAGLASGAVFPVGVTTNTFEVTDAAGNKSSCSFTVTVSDNEAPLVPELSDITEECSVVVSAPATTDNCSEIVIGTTNDPLEYNEQGSYVIHWSFDDGNGNISQANQNVIIDDVTLPTITCPSDINLTACQDTATWALPEMQDNCSGVSLEQISGPESGSLFENGTTTTISYRATDVGGNTATCSFTVARAAELTATCATTNSQLYFGYTGDQTSTINVIPAGGEGPYTVSISMNRALLCNVITNSGDESWIPGANTNSNSNIGVSCPTSGTSSLLPISTSNAFVSGVYSVNVTLMEDATFTAIVTDANGCTVTCTITVIAEDVRCFAGASGRAKVMLCHKTGNTKNPCVNICVDENAVAEHLAHGDFLGRCTTDCTPPQSNVKPEVENADLFHVIAYPNPSSNQFTFEIESKSSDTINISVFDIAGRLVKVIENHQDTTVTFGEELPRGVYLAVIEQGSNRKTIRIIKE